MRSALVLLLASVLGSSQEGNACRGVITHTLDSGDTGARYTDVAVEEEDMKCRVFRLYLVTYTTDVTNKGFCTMAASAAANGFKLNVLGEGREKLFREYLYLEKLWALQEFLGELQADRTSVSKAQTPSDVSESTVPPPPRARHTIIAFVDAYDVLVAGSPLAVVKRLLKSGKNVLFSSERGCCSTRERIMYKFNDCDPAFPPPEYETGLPYLNSGAFVGFLKPVSRMLFAAHDEWKTFRDEIVKTHGRILSHDVPRESDDLEAIKRSRQVWDPYIGGTDQLLICHIFAHYRFAAGNKEQGRTGREALGIGIDHNAKLFLSAFDMRLDAEISFTLKRRVTYHGKLLACGSYTQAKYHAAELTRMCFAWTASNPPSTFPVFLHFNGRGEEKDKMYQVATRMAWPNVTQEALWSEAFFSFNSTAVNAAAAASDYTNETGTKVLLKDACARVLPELGCGESVGDCLARWTKHRQF